MPDSLAPPSSMADAAYDEAREAVRREYRESVRPRRLRCHDAVDVGDGIYRLFVGRSVHVDIAWEGATAYRPRELNVRGFGDRDSLDGGVAAISDVAASDASDTTDFAWVGEVVEVDEVAGHVYVVAMFDGEDGFDADAARGTFFIREFPFLGPLRAIYLNPKLEAIRSSGLATWLTRSRGTTMPNVVDGPPVGAAALEDISRYDLAYLWGPPGTGKTYTIGEHVARLVAGTREKVLVVSTTNKATDEVALSIGRALRRLGHDDKLDRAVRVGKGAGLTRFEDAGMTILLEGAEALARQELARLTERLRAATRSERKAEIRARMSVCRQRIHNGSIEAVLNRGRRVVVTTAFNALQMMLSREVGELITDGRRTCSTLIVDEAGLISRASMAALSLHASTRVLLAGDPKQLAPISRIARVLPPGRARWLAKSGLSHLTTNASALSSSAAAVMLETQYRMHPDVRRAVSEFQYGGRLHDADMVTTRPTPVVSLLEGIPRAVWYVLDEDHDDLAKIRAERGRGSRSWIREVTIDVLTRLFAAAPELKSWSGLCLSPFVAQAKKLDEWLKQNGYEKWRASTIHAQQGAEAEVVVFDTVNAGSHVWPVDEWKRLVNVGMSRAREFCLLVSSRDEMREPYLRDLVDHVAPRILKWRGSRYLWHDVDVARKYPVPTTIAADPDRLGAQLESRKSMRPLLSREQERLCRLDLDGKPRLVRGVAGSGKTVILANWLARAAMDVRDEAAVRLWIVYANKSLRALVESTTQAAWDESMAGEPFPWERIEYWHIRDLLHHLFDREGLGRPNFGFDYEAGAETILDFAGDDLEPLCRGLFVDEAQDLGDETLRLLARLVEQTDAEDANSKSLIIFYDNAQNVYGRSTPRWSEFGIDMRGRSSVLKESFRSTRPIAEFALNVLYRLEPPESDSDHRELVRRGLIERVERPDGEWWRVHFNQVHGPLPTMRVFDDFDAEMTAIARRVRELVAEEGVRPADIRILYIGKNVPYRLKKALDEALVALNVKVEAQTSRTFSEDENVLVVTTPHSFKGYDAEVVIVAAADQFRSKSDGINAAALYVALTRARSVLEVYAKDDLDTDAAMIVQTLQGCDEDLSSADTQDPARLDHADVDAIVGEVGDEHRSWVEGLAGTYSLAVEPIVSAAGERLGQPVFHFTHDDVTYACLRTTVRPRERARLEDAGVVVVEPGDAVG